MRVSGVRAGSFSNGDELVSKAAGFCPLKVLVLFLTAELLLASNWAKDR